VAIGKLYRFSGNQFVVEVNYQFHNISETSWWGELTLTDYVRIDDGDSYVIELEDKRKGSCRLRKRFNRAVSGVVPPRYIYRFNGTSPIQ
jgi:hypothetical protein